MKEYCILYCCKSYFEKYFKKSTDKILYKIKINNMYFAKIQTDTEDYEFNNETLLVFNNNNHSHIVLREINYKCILGEKCNQIHLLNICKYIIIKSLICCTKLNCNESIENLLDNLDINNDIEQKELNKFYISIHPIIINKCPLIILNHIEFTNKPVYLLWCCKDHLNNNNKNLYKIEWELKIGTRILTKVIVNDLLYYYYECYGKLEDSLSVINYKTNNCHCQLVLYYDNNKISSSSKMILSQFIEEIDLNYHYKNDFIKLGDIAFMDKKTNATMLCKHMARKMNIINQIMIMSDEYIFKDIKLSNTLIAEIYQN